MSTSRKLACGLTADQRAEINTYVDRINAFETTIRFSPDSLTTIEAMKDLIDLMARAMDKLVQINTTLK